MPTDEIEKTMGDSIHYCDGCENNVGCHLARKCVLATDQPLEGLASASCSPGSAPLLTVSLAEIEERLKAWMIDEFGHPRDYIAEPELKDKWYRDYGLIYHFISDQFSANMNYNEQLSR